MLLDRSSQKRGSNGESSAAARKNLQPVPPVPKPVLRELYRALLCVHTVQEKSRPRKQALPGGMVAAATLALRPQDLLIPPTDPLTLRQCERLGNSDAESSRFPQVIHISPRVHWQVAMAMHLANGWKQRRRSSVVLAIIPEDSLSGAHAQANLELLREVSRQKLPVVYVTRTLSSQGVRRASDLRSYGLPRIAVDGSDIVAIYRVCQEALRRAREGTGPTLVDCHFMGPSNDVAFLESFLTHYQMWSPAWKQELLDQLRRANPAARSRATARTK